MTHTTLYTHKTCCEPPNSRTFLRNTFSPTETTTAALLFILLTLTVASSASANSDVDDAFYKIHWNGDYYERGVPLEQSVSEDDIITILTNKNEKYKCFVPGQASQLNFNASSQSASPRDNEKSPYDIIRALVSKDGCSLKFEFFWAYELCHGRYLRQFHEESSKTKAQITQEYYLGRTLKPEEEIIAHEEEYAAQKIELAESGRKRPTITVAGESRPFLSFNMSGGTKCDLTNTNRITRVIYVCNEEIDNSELYSIKEISTCEYEAIVLSPALCSHKDFRPSSKVEHAINCYSLDGSARKPATIITQEQEALKSSLQQRSEEQTPIAVIIDLESLIG